MIISLSDSPLQHELLQGSIVDASQTDIEKILCAKHTGQLVSYISTSYFAKNLIHVNALSENYPSMWFLYCWILTDKSHWIINFQLIDVIYSNHRAFSYTHHAKSLSIGMNLLSIVLLSIVLLSIVLLSIVYSSFYNCSYITDTIHVLLKA